ncbi:hypothetical protein HYU93_02845 [Candidatus Daviesbacteria bacterium]|nr:hypothetical protein [Candidatus Daviesbacteria bacterium]
MISNELLEKFKRLYQEKYNITLSDEEATQMATDFLNLMKVLLRPKLKKIKNSQFIQEMNQI